MATPDDRCLNCHNELPAPGPHGGRPRRYCCDACRFAFRRQRQRRLRPIDTRHQRQSDTQRQRQHLREQAERLVQTARSLASDALAEDLACPTQQTGWKSGPIAGYTASALPLFALARAVLAAAVAADRAAGASWDEIAAVLDVSPDTAARRYAL